MTDWKDLREQVLSDPEVAEEYERLRPEFQGCYCGDLRWTVKQYGRITHKHGCPARTDPFCQTHPDGCPIGPI